MENTEKNRFGLVGKNISYSFSKGYFTQKFKELGLNHHFYENFDLASIKDFQDLIKQNKNLKGLNVTIPYKELVIPYLDKLNPKAKNIGAVNTIKFTKKGLKGFNTDIYGFKKSIKPFLKKRHKKALILGTGGASKAVAFVFEEMGVKFKYVSRNPKLTPIHPRPSCERGTTVIVTGDSPRMTSITTDSPGRADTYSMN